MTCFICCFKHLFIRYSDGFLGAPHFYPKFKDDLFQEFMTIQDLAHTLGKTRQTVSKFIRQKKMNTVKSGKSFRIPIYKYTNIIANNLANNEENASSRRNNKRRHRNEMEGFLPAKRETLEVQPTNSTNLTEKDLSNGLRPATRAR